MWNRRPVTQELVVQIYYFTTGKGISDLRKVKGEKSDKKTGSVSSIEKVPCTVLIKDTLVHKNCVAGFVQWRKMFET